MTDRRLGIALGCGSARGWAHIGVLRALTEIGLRPTVVAGASVGALVGAAFANGRLDALQQWVAALTQRDVWRLMDATFRGGGIMTGNRLMQAIAASVGDTPVEQLPIPFGAVATDLYTGEEIWLREGPMMQVVRASSGLPGLFAPASHNGRWLVDGGVVNPLPVSMCRAMGAEAVIAVDLSRSVTRAGPSVHRSPAPRSRRRPRRRAPRRNRRRPRKVRRSSGSGRACSTGWSNHFAPGARNPGCSRR